MDPTLRSLLITVGGSVEITGGLGLLSADRLSQEGVAAR